MAAARARAGDTDDGATATADSDPTSAWGGGDEAAAASDFDPTSANTCMDIGAADTSPATVARKRKARGSHSHSHVTQDGHKRQRGAALPLTTQGSTEAGT